MTDSEHAGQNATAVGKATVVGPAPYPRSAHALDVLAWLRDHGPASPEPSLITANNASHVVELRFDRGPEGVITWSRALGFSEPSSNTSLELLQAIVESGGTALGWRVELRHVHTARAGESIDLGGAR